MHLGYLISQYPAVNHTFILREIRTLRTLGFDVRVVSIRETRPNLGATQPGGGRGISPDLCGFGRRTAAHPGRPSARLIPRAPRLTPQPSGMRVRLGGWDVRRAAAHVGYFAEAVVAGDHLVRLRRRPFSHALRFHSRPHRRAPFPAAFLPHHPWAGRVQRCGPVPHGRKGGAGRLCGDHQPLRLQPGHAGQRAPALGQNPCPAVGRRSGSLRSTGASRPRYELGPFKILSVGRLAAAKAYHMLIAALLRGSSSRDGRWN